ncbi:hypothetical protein GGR51DRAFT_577580 [Nemania sp. FL0031]|nr:hypothetical protein GGR51DRAFT_577580 [Nemania sp. FL0031]
MDPSHKLTTQVCRCEVSADFDDGMVQDAMAIILFPAQHTNGVFSRPLRDHYKSWEAQTLPDPLKEPDDECDDTPSDDLARLYRLYSRLLLFIEDYLTKATAADPSREYFCLSPLSLHNQYLTYLGHPISPRFSAANLSNLERQRLFRAFLRYELLCKMCCYDDFGDSTWYYELSSLWEYNGQTFQEVEAEAIACVQSYVESLHRAMAIQCGYTKRELLVDDLFHDLSCFGFDLATTILQATLAGKQARDHVCNWYCNLFTHMGRIRLTYIWDFKDCLLGFDPLCRIDEHYTEGPGMYKMLYPIGQSSTMQRYLYRRKAWAFLDDIRLHPARLQHLCFTGADWIYECPTSLHDLHDLHDRPVDEHLDDVEMQLQYPTPPFPTGCHFVGLDPFWQ